MAVRRRCGGGAESLQWHGSGAVVRVRCGARQCNAEAVCGGSAVWCAQQQPIALNPGVDGADLADFKAHNVTSEDQRSAGRRWVASPVACQAHLLELAEGGGRAKIPRRFERKLSISSSMCLPLSAAQPTKASPPPGHSSHTLGSNAAAPLPAKDKGQRNYQSAYITLPVLGSMRLPATNPVVGSVPFGRRKSRMCGSGLAAAGAGAGSERATTWRMRQGSGGSRDEPVAGTCGWRSAPTRGSAARPHRATPSQSAAAPWEHSWQCVWAR